MGGNLYNVKPEVGRYDAGYGAFLAGDGKGGFAFIPSGISGFHLEGEIRDILEIKAGTLKLLLVARSNGPVQVLKVILR